jgi:energy-coupling factor transporter transmembrane protein EcfT
MKNIPPIIPLLWSIGAIIAVLLIDNTIKLLSVSIFFIIITILYSKSLKVLSTSLKFTLPFTIPLTIVHGIINPLYSKSYIIYDLIPIRLDGLYYSAHVSINIFILTCAAVSWKFINTKRLLIESTRIKIPLSLITIISVAVSAIRMINIRINIVYLAQQARGIPAGPGFFYKIKALPAVILPVITSTLIECNNRGNILTNRGLGFNKFKFSTNYVNNKIDYITGLSVIIATLLIKLFL